MDICKWILHFRYPFFMCLGLLYGSLLHKLIDDKHYKYHKKFELRNEKEISRQNR